MCLSHCRVVETWRRTERQAAKHLGCLICHFIWPIKNKINIQADLSRYYVTENLLKFGNRMVQNRNVIPVFPRGGAVASFQLLSSHDCLVAHVYTLSICSCQMCVLCKEGNCIMNQDHPPDCTVFNSGNTQSRNIILGW
jgi:hypothetical protein